MVGTEEILLDEDDSKHFYEAIKTVHNKPG